MLAKSLCEQTDVTIETIFMRGDHSSAADSFNQALSCAHSDYLVFVHQDITFSKPDFLKNLILEIKREKRALYGLCGTEFNVKKMVSTTYSNVFHGLWNRNVGTPIIQKKKVSGLDEIFLAFHKDLSRDLRFDDQFLNGWHLYVEDLCLAAEMLGIPVYVLPFPSQHKGVLEMPNYMSKYGILPKEFFNQLKQLRKKYKNGVSRIVCPCVTIKTSGIYFWTDFMSLYVHHRCKKFLRDLSLI